MIENSLPLVFWHLLSVLCLLYFPGTFIFIQALWKSGGLYARDQKSLFADNPVHFRLKTCFELSCIANSDTACWAWQMLYCDHQVLFVALWFEQTFCCFSFCGGHSAHRWPPPPKVKEPCLLKLKRIHGFQGWVGYVDLNSVKVILKLVFTECWRLNNLCKIYASIFSKQGPSARSHIDRASRWSKKMRSILP